ncbi:MAG: hypothetical protein KOO62_03090 [candidate division Zixibacteria bacterium]|nr:hypothetical protein [candidate division Zixibacteria bacterium]
MDFRKPKLLFPIASLVLALYYTLPMLLNLRNWGGRDWDLFTCIAAIPVGSVLDYGQFPFWNMYLGGGNILFHHPEVGVLTPFFLLYLVFGAVIGLKLQVFICYFLGFWGSQRLFNRLGISTLVSIVSSVAYFGSVHFALHFAEGHMPFTHYAFLPWFLFFVFTAAENRLSLLWAGGILALMILGNGAAVPLMYTIMFSFMLIGLRAIQGRSMIELKNLILATIAGLGLAAVKLVPMIVYMLQNKWAGNPDESIPFHSLGTIFFGLKHSMFTRNFPEQFWAWHEYGAYLSPLLVGVAVLLLICRFRLGIVWAIVAGFFLLLGMGDFGAFSPWSLLTQLPGFSSTRCTGRAFQFVILSTAVLGGFGFDWWRHRFKDIRFKRESRIALWLAMSLVVGTNLVLAWPILDRAHSWPPREVHRSPQFKQVVDEDALAYENFLANRGSLITPWLSAYPPSRGLVGSGDVVHPEFVTTGKVRMISREYTPNIIVYEFEGIAAGEMMIGMGYDPGWRASNGRNLYARDGLICFNFDTGRQTVVLNYRPPFFYAGCAVSLVTLILLATIAVRLPRSKFQSQS